MPSFLKQFAEIWGRLKPGQRFAVIGAALATLALTGTLIYFGSQPEYGVLFSDLKPEDGQMIVEKLKAANVPYKLSNNGTVVSVPSDRVAEMRLQMAASGALSGGHVGFDLFDKTNFGATDFTQQVNYQRALAGELARTLEGMAEVESARVHITQPRESLFADKSERAKASIMIRPRQGRELSRERTEAVVNLVASAVEGLDPADVSVMDTQGRLLSAPTRSGANGALGNSAAFNSHLEARRKFESETAARIVALLEPIVGPNRVRADVAAELDLSQVEQTEEKYDPQTPVVRTQQTSQELRNASGNGLGNVVGARANDPAVQTPPPTTPAPSPTGDQRTSSTTNYEISKTVKHTVGGSGRITRLSTSVVVDYKLVNGMSTARDAEELKKMQELVAAAVGIDSARGDQIVVQTIPFDQPSIEVRNLTFLERYNEYIRMAIKYGALIFVFLLLYIFVIRPARKALKAAAQPPLQLPAATGGASAPQNASTTNSTNNMALPSSEHPPANEPAALPAPRTVAEIEAEMEAQLALEMASVAPELKRAGAIKKQLIDRTKQDPETIAMTIRSWLQEKNRGAR